MGRWPYDNEGEKVIFSEDGHYNTHAGCAYGPDLYLRQAAEQAGISENIFVM